MANQDQDPTVLERQAQQEGALLALLKRSQL